MDEPRALTGTTAMRPKRRWLKRFALMLSSLLFCGALLLLLEAATRFLKPDINFQDTERELLREKAFGGTYGWKPNAEGICFGKRVFIDSSGFRKMTAPEAFTESWVVLGDSVAFGVGVDTEDTYVQLLQNNFPSRKVLNTAVIGYNIRNYRDVLYHLMSDRSTAPNLKRVLLFLCLNDIDPGRMLEKDLEGGIFQSDKAQKLLSFLRRHSKLYILLKDAVSDRSKHYFLHDAQFYADGNEDFTSAMSVLDEMNTTLRARGIDFTVVVLPYEYQLRTGESQYLLPQKRLAAYFNEKGIAHIDAYDYFRQTGRVKEYYLYADFGHFSKQGHQMVFNLLKERLKEVQSAE